MAGNKNAAVIRSAVAAKIQLIFGIIILILFGVGGLGSGFIPLGIVGVVIGLLLIFAGVSRNNLIKLFKSYAANLANDPIKSIDSLASAQNMPVNVVQSKLQIMINKGYFVNAAIDRQRNCLVFGNEAELLQQAASTNMNAIQPSAELVTVICQGCGAPNKTQKGSSSKCEFCGAPLK
jgi:hypothetical protein